MELKSILLFIFGTGIILLGCQASADRGNMEDSDRSDSDEEWTILFDGINTDHWRGYNMEHFPDQAWSIEGDELVFSPTGQGGLDLITKEKYQDFELRLEWNISEGGNSGIFHHVIEQPDHEIYWSGPEMQILDNDAYPNSNDDQLAGSLYDLKPAEPQNTKPQGEWNSVRIISDGNHVEYWQNGEKVVEFERWSSDWFDRVGETKFECHPSFGTVPNGHIGLQDHGDVVRFRNIEIRRLH